MDFRKIITSNLFTISTAFLSVLSIPATHAADCQPIDRSLAGLYELSGVMETGSIIILLADGRFGYQLTYGAYDEWAKGCWTKKGMTLSLNVREMEVNHPDGKKFKSLTMALNAKGELVRNENGKLWGHYLRVQKY